MSLTITGRDLISIANTVRELNEDLDQYDGPEVVMLSIGYAEVDCRGELTTHGRSYLALEPVDVMDGFCPVCGYQAADPKRSHADCADAEIELDAE